jgi:hypothetical protein
VKNPHADWISLSRVAANSLCAASKFLVFFYWQKKTFLVVLSLRLKGVLKKLVGGELWLCSEANAACRPEFT